MIRACIYARYSSTNQREESIDAQLRVCREYAARREYAVVHEYCDHAISGRTDDRPEFQHMLSDAEYLHSFDVVICYQVDRFARNRYDSAIHKFELKKHGVKVEYATQNFGDEPEGILLESLMEGYAEYYSLNLAKHVKRGQQESALKCQVAGGIIPLGYVKGADKRFQIEEREAAIVKEVFARYVAGENPLKIARDFNARGLKSKQGKPFTAKSFTEMLANIRYTGLYKFGDVEVEGGMPVIIDKETFDLAQERLASSHHRGARFKAKADYILSGKVFCGYCNKPLLGESGHNHDGRPYFYYKCASRKSNSKACAKRIDRKEFLERVIGKYIIENVLTDEAIEEIAEAVVRIIEKENNNQSEIDAISKQIKDNEKKINHCLEIIEDGCGTKSIVARIKDLESENETLQSRLEELSVRLPSLTVDHIAFWLYQFKSGNIEDTEYLKTIINTMVNSIYVFDESPKERKIRILLNLSANAEREFISSDLSEEVHFNLSYPNHSTVYYIQGRYIVLEFHAKIA